MPADNPSKAIHCPEAPAVTFRTAALVDARDIWQLVDGSGVLDGNSLYCYLLMCRDFGETCVVACRGSAIVGFVTAYQPPGRVDTVFVWQIGVAAEVRGQGLAKRLLHTLVSLPACRKVRYLEATITPSNAASRRLFHSFAREAGAACEVGEGFTAASFGGENHEDEELFRIGPLVISVQEDAAT